MAYTFVLIQACMGWPLWGEAQADPVHYSVDVLVWACLNFILHVRAFALLIYQEQQLKAFPSADDEELWRFWHRRSGVSRFDFVPVLESGAWVRFKPNERIPTEAGLYLIVSGTVHASAVNIRRRDDDAELPSARFYEFALGSGACFDMQMCNFLGVDVGFLKDRFEVEATTETRCYVFPVQSLRNVAHHGSPLVRSIWRDFILHAVADVANRVWIDPLIVIERAGNLSGDVRALAWPVAHPDFAPLPENPAENCLTWKSFKANVGWVVSSLDIRLPRGLRHRPHPLVGVKSSESVSRRFAGHDATQIEEV